MKRALVLAGGGAKGAYQIGAWKAFKKLGIEFDIVTGTSIGALNGALIVQNDYRKALKLWNKINYKMLFNEELEGTDIPKRFIKETLNGGINIDELEHMIKKNINIKKIKRSNIDLGIVAFNLKTLKPKYIKKNEIELEDLSDYLVASASCYPVFKIKNIKDEQLIDGGYYDNMPINLAIELGGQEIYAIDLKSIGFNRQPNNKDIKVHYIRPKNKSGSFLNFNKNQAKRLLKMGYHDVMKYHDKLDGNHYTFYKNQLSNNANKYRNETIDKINNIKNNNTFRLSNIIIDNFKKKNSFNDLIEEIGKMCGISNGRIYTINRFNRYIQKTILKTKSVSIDHLLELKIPKKIEITKYFYEHIKENNYTEDFYRLISLFPKEFVSSIYISLLMR